MSRSIQYILLLMIILLSVIFLNMYLVVSKEVSAPKLKDIYLGIDLGEEPRAFLYDDLLNGRIIPLYLYSYGEEIILWLGEYGRIKNIKSWIEDKTIIVVIEVEKGEKRALKYIANKDTEIYLAVYTNEQVIYYPLAKITTKSRIMEIDGNSSSDSKISIYALPSPDIINISKIELKRGYLLCEIKTLHDGYFKARILIDRLPIFTQGYERPKQSDHVFIINKKCNTYRWLPVKSGEYHLSIPC